MNLFGQFTILFIKSPYKIMNPEKSDDYAAGQRRMQWFQATLQKVYARIGRDYFAYGMMVICALLYPVPFFYSSYHNFHPLQMNLIRGLTTWITHLLICRYFGMDVDFKSASNNKYLMWRNIIMLVNQFAYGAMHYVVSMPVINILNISGSIFVFVLDYFIHGVQVNRKQLIGMILGFLGVIITVNGDYLVDLFDPEYSRDSDFEHYIVHDIKWKVIFSFLYIFVSMLWAYGLIIQKNIVGVSGIKISYHLGVFFTFTTALAYPIVVSKPISFDLFLSGCLYSGILMAFIQIMFTSAFNITKNAGVLTMLTMLTVVTSYVVSLFKYHENVNPICLVGLVLLAYGLIKTIINGEVSGH